MRIVLAVLLLAFQLVMIVHARFSDAKYYGWAPHDAQNEYWIHVQVGARRLTPEQVRERYRDPWNGLNPRAIGHVIRLVRQYEQTYGRSDSATVELQYRTNGRPTEVWRWPEP